MPTVESHANTMWKQQYRYDSQNSQISYEERTTNNSTSPVPTLIISIKIIETMKNFFTSGYSVRKKMQSFDMIWASNKWLVF